MREAAQAFALCARNFSNLEGFEGVFKLIKLNSAVLLRREEAGKECGDVAPLEGCMHKHEGPDWFA